MSSSLIHLLFFLEKHTKKTTLLKVAFLSKCFSIYQILKSTVALLP